MVHQPIPNTIQNNEAMHWFMLCTKTNDRLQSILKIIIWQKKYKRLQIENLLMKWKPELRRYFGLRNLDSIQPTVIHLDSFVKVTFVYELSTDNVVYYIE